MTLSSVSRRFIRVECQRYNRHASASLLASQRRVGDTRVVLSTLQSSIKRRLLVLDRTSGRCGTKRILDHRPKTRLFEVPFVGGARTALQQGYRWSVLILSLSRRRHPCSTSTFPIRWCGWLRTRAQWEPTPVSLACLECPVDGRGLEPLIITAPTHATDEIWSSSETTMHNGPGFGNINAINTESRCRAQFENLLDALVSVQMARGRSRAGLAETCQLCVIVPVPADRPPSISLRLVKWGWSPPISQSPKALIRMHRGGTEAQRMVSPFLISRRGSPCNVH